MEYIYITKKGRFTTNQFHQIDWNYLHSPNEETPALIYPNGAKVWYFEGKRHRITGPAVIDDSFGGKWFYLNGLKYSFEDWCEAHPNKTLLALYLLKN